MKKNERLLSLDVLRGLDLFMLVGLQPVLRAALLTVPLVLYLKPRTQVMATPQENKEEQNLCVLFFLSFFALICHSEHAVEESKKTDEMSHIRST